MSFFDYPSEPAPQLGDADYFLPDATDEEWTTLLAHTRHRWFRAGDAVISERARDRSLYLILDGNVEVLVERGRRGHRQVASLSAGSVIGELSFFDGDARSAMVRAVTAAELAELSPADFEALAAADPALARRLLFELGRFLARRLRAAQQAALMAEAR